MVGSPPALFTPKLIVHEVGRSPKINRQRGFGGGRKGKIPSGKEKVCFILFYLKVYPTFDLLSAVSGINRGECNRCTRAPGR